VERIILYLFFGFSLLLYSCNKNELSGNDYIKHIDNESNNLKQTKSIEDLTYQLQYLPTEYLLLNEYKTFDLSEKLVNAKLKENDSLMYFKLRILGKNEIGEVLNYKTESSSDYYSRIEFLSYGFEENIILISGVDTLIPAIYHFERTYGVVPYLDFLFAFGTGKRKHKELSVVIDDKIFRNGLIKFNYSENTLNSIPKLKVY
jgi:hypothetical protein